MINAYQAVLEAQELAVPEPATIWLAGAGMIALTLCTLVNRARGTRRVLS
ncbi:MAG: PEP-CTERM sorting domain-containing protein [Planctomycetales bacterium]|nr:PEP-CTERM sorting domain-containing protein [Planctomycetales bacterium]